MNEYISKYEPIEEIQRIYCTGCNSYNGVMCRSCEHQDDIYHRRYESRGRTACEAWAVDTKSPCRCCKRV